VIADGQLIFSKAEVDRFPDEGEVEARLAELRKGRNSPPPGQSGKAAVLTRILGKLRS